MFHWRSHFLRFVLLASLSVGFACEPAKMDDIKLSELLLRNSTTKPATIRLKSEENINGYLVSIQHDSLEWYDSESGPNNRRHVAFADNIISVSIPQTNDMRTFWFGLSGCGIGGILGCSAEFTGSVASAYGTTQTSPRWNWAVPIIAAVAGAGIGAYIGTATDPRDYVDVWRLRARYPH